MVPGCPKSFFGCLTHPTDLALRTALMAFVSLDWTDRLAASLPLPLADNLICKQVAELGKSSLSRHFDLRSEPAGQILYEAGEPIDHVHFPVDTLIALDQPCGIEVALAGREGMTGWTALSGLRHSPYRAVVRGRGGRVLRLPVEHLVRAAAASDALQSLLAQYVVVTAVQMAEGLGAHCHHRLSAAIARWLLMRHDRVGGDWISVHHQEIAESLGSRRASITDCLHILEGDQLLRCRRGRILIRSRADLETVAGGAYGAAECLYRGSLGAFGKTATAVPPPPPQVAAPASGSLSRTSDRDAVLLRAFSPAL